MSTACTLQGEVRRELSVPPSPSTAPRRLRIGLVGTFPPRPCGLATFTADVAASLNAATDVVVVALVDSIDSLSPGVTFQLVQTSEASAKAAAVALSAEVDVVLIEHEFGIFGGNDSAVLRAFTDHLTVPYVITLHTVLEPFRPWQATALTEPLANAAMVFVFSDEAATLVTSQFPEIGSRCRTVPHAAPVAMYRTGGPGIRQELGVSAHAKVVTTFGLLSPSKGIEHVIRALPMVRRRVGDVVYLVAGRTHPEVARRHGEEYRRSLESLTRSLGVDDIVQFRDWFHDVDELSAVLHATDVFATPYGDADQIVSGALSFALAAGLPFVSTPYRYAVGLADLGCGITTPFGDDEALADAVSRLLIEDDLRHSMAARATVVSAARSWPQIGRRIQVMLQDVVDARVAERRHPETAYAAAHP